MVKALLRKFFEKRMKRIAQDRMELAREIVTLNEEVVFYENEAQRWAEERKLSIEVIKKMLGGN